MFRKRKLFQNRKRGKELKKIINKEEAIKEAIRQIGGTASRKEINDYCIETYNMPISNKNLHALINYEVIKTIRIYNKNGKSISNNGPLYKIRNKILKIDKEKTRKIQENIRKKDRLFWKIYNKNQQLSSKQKEVYEYVEKGISHIMLNFSRQTGKSTLLGYIVTKWLFYNEGERIYLFAPTEDQAKEMYTKIVEIIYEYPFFEKYCKTIGFEKGIHVYNDNFIEFKSASPGAHIRGKTATKEVLDESGDIIDEKYYGEILPMMAAKQYNKYGEEIQKVIIEAGTPPIQKNHFYYTQQSKEIVKVIQPWHECEHADEKFIMKQKSILPEIIFRREYLAEFVEEGATCFPTKWWHSKKYKMIDGTNICLNENNNRKDVGLSNIDLIIEQKCANDYTDLIGFTDKIRKQVKDGAIFTIGFDNGRQVDPATLCVWRVDTFPVRLYYNKEFKLGTIQETLAEEIRLLYELFEPIEINIDWTNEKGFKEVLNNKGVPTPLTKNYKYGLIVFNQKSKTEMFTTARNLVQKGLIRLPKKEENLYYQFVQQQFEINAGKYKFYHPSNTHDDQLWASLLALKNVKIEPESTDDIKLVNIWLDKEKEENTDYNVKSTGKLVIKGHSIGNFKKLRENFNK